MQKAQILVADHDQSALANLTNGISKAGYTVLGASDGEKAISLCAEHSPELAIFDLCMPDVSGIETVREIYAKYHVPFIIFSACAEPHIVKEAVSIGTLAYFVKPLAVKQLLPGIEAALERAAEINMLKETGYHLNRALNTGRETSTAIGIMMERYGLTSELAFERLKSRARSQRRKLAAISEEIVLAAETLCLCED